MTQSPLSSLLIVPAVLHSGLDSLRIQWLQTCTSLRTQMGTWWELWGLLSPCPASSRCPAIVGTASCPSQPLHPAASKVSSLQVQVRHWPPEPPSSGIQCQPLRREFTSPPRGRSSFRADLRPVCASVGWKCAEAVLVSGLQPAFTEVQYRGSNLCHEPPLGPEILCSSSIIGPELTLSDKSLRKCGHSAHS